MEVGVNKAVPILLALWTSFVQSQVPGASRETGLKHFAHNLFVRILYSVAVVNRDPAPKSGSGTSPRISTDKRAYIRLMLWLSTIPALPECDVVANVLLTCNSAVGQDKYLYLVHDAMAGLL
jgi:hypothetical protein